MPCRGCSGCGKQGAGRCAWCDGSGREYESVSADDSIAAVVFGICVFIAVVVVAIFVFGAFGN